MTTKRFVMDEDGNITDTFDDRTLYVENRYTECNYFCKILNELYEENKELKSNIINLIDKKINKLKNINEVSLIPRESVEILKELKKEIKE